MFGIGGWELLVIAAVALIVLGPKGLPSAARALGRIAQQLRRATQELRETIELDPELRELPKAIDELNRPFLNAGPRPYPKPAPLPKDQPRDEAVPPFEGPGNPKGSALDDPPDPASPPGADQSPTSERFEGSLTEVNPTHHPKLGPEGEMGKPLWTPDPTPDKEGQGEQEA